MMECVQGHAGCLPAPKGYIKAAMSLCKKYNALFVCDEIQTGFGRTGSLMAYQKEGIKPDLVMLGKALSGGMMPIGMVLGNRETIGQLGPGEYETLPLDDVTGSLGESVGFIILYDFLADPNPLNCRNNSTFGGNPLACAVASEAVNIVLDENLSERSAVLGQRLFERLSKIKYPHTTIKATGRGLFCALYLDESHPSGRVTAARLCALMRQRGVLTISASNRIRIAPPLTISEEDLWHAVDVVDLSIRDLVDVDVIA